MKSLIRRIWGDGQTSLHLLIARRAQRVANRKPEVAARYEAVHRILALRK